MRNEIKAERTNTVIMRLSANLDLSFLSLISGINRNKIDSAPKVKNNIKKEAKTVKVSNRAKSSMVIARVNNGNVKNVKPLLIKPSPP